jgi:LysR family glycine cleavage system transcriptional activator
VSGLGIALLPRYLVEPELAAKRLEIVASDLFQPKTSYYLIVPETRASAAAIRSFAKWLIAEAQNWSADDQRFNRAKAATKT